MFKLIEVARKSSVLNHPSLPCISNQYTINLAAGCAFGCRYCYAQSFRNNPGPGKVLFYANTLEILTRELERKRKLPELVYFSTACEPFMPHDKILDALYRAMEMLLENYISLSISTKARIPDRFIRLFSDHPDKVRVHVGLTTNDDLIRQALEPKATSVEQRLYTLKVLVSEGIGAEARIDPLVPGLTDSEESLASICKAIAGCGVDDAVASYLFLRRTDFKRLKINFNGWSFDEMSKRLYTNWINDYCGNGTIRTTRSDYRAEKYKRIKEIAGEHGISIRLCRCKNSDVTDETCSLKKRSSSFGERQPTLF
jgi:DNA repair photolyase